MNSTLVEQALKLSATIERLTASELQGEALLQSAQLAHALDHYIQHNNENPEDHPFAYGWCVFIEAEDRQAAAAAARQMLSSWECGHEPICGRDDPENPKPRFQYSVKRFKSPK